MKSDGQPVAEQAEDDAVANVGHNADDEGPQLSLLREETGEEEKSDREKVENDRED